MFVLGELREFYYLDHKLSENYLSQIEDGLIQYKHENIISDKPNQSFEISTGNLGDILYNTLGIPLPRMTYSREGESENIKVEEYKVSNEISQFSRLVKYLDPAITNINEPMSRESWNELFENQFIKFECELNVSNLYLFTNFTKTFGQPTMFNKHNDDEFNEYVRHSELIESKKSQKIILRPNYSPDITKHYFIADIKRRYLAEDIELKDLNNEKMTVIGKIDKKIQGSEKEIIFDLSEMGLMQTMNSKEIKRFIKQFNQKSNNSIMRRFHCTEQDIYGTKPAINFKPIAIYKH